ncbi:hypothetical protein C4B63_134g69 [Trypanosoma cruzi]|uniref:Uncharacterized protein n=1 Tax=Trypanosoma cruzi TaxID=5693 RepID=A0A2V2UNX9_TRYCR|nr:hypothetical protein C4B63_134g69 [Trypanosoma cruzi]
MSLRCGWMLLRCVLTKSFVLLSCLCHVFMRLWALPCELTRPLCRYLERRLRADGRFDCSLHASCFGMVLFRWLTLADEETAGLMQRWSDLLASSSAMNEAGGHRYPHRVSLGLTQVQRRVYICVALAAEGGDGDACVSRCDVDALVDLLKTAADEMEGHFVLRDVCDIIEIENMRRCEATLAFLTVCDSGVRYSYYTYIYKYLLP